MSTGDWKAGEICGEVLRGPIAKIFKIPLILFFIFIFFSVVGGSLFLKSY